MDIRTKLVFALVAVALGSMFFLGISMYANAEDALRNSRLERLEGLAESKRDGLEQVFAGWIDRVSLVSSRTQLRLILQEYNATPRPEAAARIHRILEDAVQSVDVIEALAVFDLRDELVSSTGPEAIRQRPIPPSEATPVADGVFYQGLGRVGDNLLRVGFIALLRLDGELLGTLHVTMNAQPLRDVAEDLYGMGETGETVVAAQDEDGILYALHGRHPDSPETWDPANPGPAADLVDLVIRGEDTIYSQGITDDRGVPVWVAVRTLPGAGMVLLVKVDEEEERASLEAFRKVSMRLGLALGAFAIIFGTFLGFRFSKPIIDLAQVADRIRGGALSARAAEEGEDEVGLLARTFNDMAEEMENRLTLLREFQRYFQFSRDMLCIAGPDGFFKRVNPAFEKTLGWSTEELLSQTFLAFVHPDDLRKTEEEIERLAHGLPTISFENRYRVPSGEYRHLMWTAHPDTESGLIYAIARDITDLHRSREKTARELRSLRKRLAEAEAGQGGGRS